MTRATSNPVSVTIAPQTLPSWLSGQPLYKWVDIPNSIRGAYYTPQLANGVSGMGLNPQYRINRGFPISSTGVLTHPLNKFGVTRGGATGGTSDPAYTTNTSGNWGAGPVVPPPGGNVEWFGYGNFPWDRVRNRILMGAGENYVEDNSVFALEINHEVPVWVPEVVRSSEAQDHKMYGSVNGVTYQGNPANPNYDAHWNVLTDFDAVGHPNADGSPNNPRWSRWYDGRPRGGHMEMSLAYNPARNWFLSLGRGQLYPYDLGTYHDVIIGDCNAGDWKDRLWQGYDANGVPIGDTIPRIPGVSTSLLAAGPAIGEAVAGTYISGCHQSMDNGDIFLVCGSGGNVHRLTNSLIGSGQTPWEPMGPSWFSLYSAGTTDPWLYALGRTGSNGDKVLGYNLRDNYLLMIGSMNGQGGSSALQGWAIYDFNNPSAPYPCTFRTGTQLGGSLIGPCAANVSAFDTPISGLWIPDRPVWNSDLNVFLWYERSTAKVIYMEPRANWVFYCDYLTTTNNPELGWCPQEYSRQGWDYLPNMHLMVMHTVDVYQNVAGGSFQGMKCFRTA